MASNTDQPSRWWALVYVAGVILVIALLTAFTSDAGFYAGMAVLILVGVGFGLRYLVKRRHQ